MPSDEIAQRRLEVLAWLVKEKRLEIKVAVAVDEDGAPTPPGMEVPYFHEKIGVLRDRLGDGVVFQGSINESATAWLHNFESFSVFQSWDGTAGHFDLWVGKFETALERRGPRFPSLLASRRQSRTELVQYAPDRGPAVQRCRGTRGACRPGDPQPVPARCPPPVGGPGVG